MASHWRHLIHCEFEMNHRGFRATSAFFLPYLPLGLLDDQGVAGVD
jgi:hypothetical protein